MGNEKVFEMEEVLKLQKTENIANDSMGVTITISTITTTFPLWSTVSNSCNDSQK